MVHQCQSHDIPRASKKLCIKSFSFNEVVNGDIFSFNKVVNGDIQCPCIINIIKVFFTAQKDFS